MDISKESNNKKFKMEIRLLADGSIRDVFESDNPEDILKHYDDFFYFDDGYMKTIYLDTKVHVYYNGQDHEIGDLVCDFIPWQVA